MQRNSPSRQINTMSTRDVARRVKEILREGGIRTLWFKVLGETFYRRMWLFERRLDEPIASLTAPDDIEFGTLCEDEIERCSELRPERTSQELTARLARGERCYVARKLGIVVGFTWVVRRSAWIDYLGCTLDFGPDDYYLYEVIVAQECRGQRIAAALLAHTYRELGQLEASRAILAINLDNDAGLRALTRAGERRFAVQGYVGPRRFRREFRHQHDSYYWDRVELAVASRENHYIDDVLALLKIRAYGRILDRWAGNCRAGPMLKTDLFEEANVTDALLHRIPGNQSDAIGIDISPTVVAKARQGGTAPGARFVVGDVRHLPFPTDSFSLVFSPSTLDHFSDLKDLGRSLAEIKRILSPEGVLILTLDNRQNIFDPLLRLVGRFGWLPYFVGRSYTIREMTSELAAAGFDVTDTTSLIQHPRLVGVATTNIVNRIGWAWLRSAVKRAFLAAERLENTRLKYFFGCFVAARAVPRKK
jgi:SAM-dependent methyltransferase